MPESEITDAVEAEDVTDAVIMEDVTGVVVVEDVTDTVLVEDATEVVFVEPVTDAVEIGDVTEAVGKRSGCDTGAVKAVGLALAAWWQAARFLFFSISAGPRWRGR